MGATVEYRCPTGSVTLGAATRSCQTNGLWSDESPTCKRKEALLTLMANRIKSHNHLLSWQTWIAVHWRASKTANWSLSTAAPLSVLALNTRAPKTTRSSERANAAALHKATGNPKSQNVFVRFILIVLLLLIIIVTLWFRRTVSGIASIRARLSYRGGSQRQRYSHLFLRFRS